MIDTNVKDCCMFPGLLSLSWLGDQYQIINLGSVAGKEVYEKGNVYCA